MRTANSVERLLSRFQSPLYSNVSRVRHFLYSMLSSSLRLEVAYRWYVLFKQSRQLVSSSCFGVRPFSEACVATGMNMGNWTGPCGRCSVAARARVVCVKLVVSHWVLSVRESRFFIRTEHFARSSYLKAEAVAGGTMSFSSEGIAEGLSDALVWFDDRRCTV